MKRLVLGMMLLALVGVGLLLAGDVARKKSELSASSTRIVVKAPTTGLAVPSASVERPVPPREEKPARKSPPVAEDAPTPERFKALLAEATDPRTMPETRESALMSLAASPLADAETVARIAALAVSSSVDLETRFVATGALKDLAAREDLAAATRAALLAVAEKAPSSDLRGTALASVPAGGASEAEVAKLAGFLSDDDATVRVSAALALVSADGSARGTLGPAIEQAFARETDPAVATALVSAALRMTAGDASILERLAATETAKSTPDLARQIADYRALMASGETDPARIERLRAASESSRRE